MSVSFARAVQRAGLDGLTFHGLRHAAITTMAEAGSHPKVAAQRAGHSTTRLTLDLYTHASDDADRDAARALQKRFAVAFSDGCGTDVARRPDSGVGTGA